MFSSATLKCRLEVEPVPRRTSPKALRAESSTRHHLASHLRNSLILSSACRPARPRRSPSHPSPNSMPAPRYNVRVFAVFFKWNDLPSMRRWRKLHSITLTSLEVESNQALRKAFHCSLKLKVPLRRVLRVVASGGRPTEKRRREECRGRWDEPARAPPARIYSQGHASAGPVRTRHSHAVYENGVWDTAISRSPSEHWCCVHLTLEKPTATEINKKSGSKW